MKFIKVPDFNIKNAFVLGNGREVRKEGAVTYIPIYYTMFLRPSAQGEVML